MSFLLKPEGIRSIIRLHGMYWVLPSIFRSCMERVTNQLFTGNQKPRIDFPLRFWEDELPIMSVNF